jgi:hypothetical protein
MLEQLEVLKVASPSAVAFINGGMLATIIIGLVAFLIKSWIKKWLDSRFDDRLVKVKHELDVSA